MKLAVLFSGGKDSCLALHKARIGGHEICYLISIIPENFDSFMFHKPDFKLLEKQAEMLGVKLVILKSRGEKDAELEDLRTLIRKVKDKVEGIAVGGIASNYQGDRIKGICRGFDLKFIAPLWNYKSEEIWKELLENNFKIILTKTACEGLDKSWLGVVIDKGKLEELKKLSKKYKFRIDFEGGEAESAVLFMPEFKKEIKIKFNVKSEGKYRHWIKIKEIK